MWTARDISMKKRRTRKSSVRLLIFSAHLARPGELLSSLFVRRLLSVVRSSTFHILIFSSETTGPIATKLWWNSPWIAPFQNCVRWSRLPTKLATKLKIEKKGWNLKKIFSPETTEPISTKLCWNDPWVVPFQNCARQRRPVSKMAPITKNRNFFKWPKLLYFKPESAQIWTV